MPHLEDAKMPSSCQRLSVGFKRSYHEVQDTSPITTPISSCTVLFAGCVGPRGEGSPALSLSAEDKVQCIGGGTFSLRGEKEGDFR